MSQPLRTLSEWMRAAPEARAGGLDRCREIVRALDSEIHAWVEVRPRSAGRGGALAGIPFGAKDIMETRGLPTEYGSPIYRGRCGTRDSAIVTELERRGAVLFGKTQTAAFAYVTPAPTRNPRNLAHTPGGSSSGSAAAVAAGMVPLALGTQTKGSVLRPASYCGVTGFKPTFGRFSMDGILPFAPSLDTLGFFTDTADDMLALWSVLAEPPGETDVPALGVPDPMPAVHSQMAQACTEAVTALRRAGVSVRSVDIAGMLSTLAEAAHIVMVYEGARVHRQRWEAHGPRLGELADMVRTGLEIPDAQYEEARHQIERGRTRMRELFETTPVVLVPAATGPAPAGLASTGDPSMNSPWTALGTPAISVPMPVGSGLPLGLQLTAAHGQDGRLLGTAADVTRILDAGRR